MAMGAIHLCHDNNETAFDEAMDITKLSSTFLTVTRGSATFIDAGIDNVIDVNVDVDIDVNVDADDTTCGTNKSYFLLGSLDNFRINFTTFSDRFRNVFGSFLNHFGSFSDRFLAAFFFVFSASSMS